jgi:hypothetical protein
VEPEAGGAGLSLPEARALVSGPAIRAIENAASIRSLTANLLMHVSGDLRLMRVIVSPIVHAPADHEAGQSYTKAC